MACGWTEQGFDGSPRPVPQPTERRFEAGAFEQAASTPPTTSQPEAETAER